ncbi:hypothetical protein [Thioalbus denitrificans]|uniref:Uncharacterized protein n=1 Tax=Thioalbus denitrificans TaxID=547122 RepID=A0A369BU22_9GAMM|nr:hypothetical protein [Thioalbus denitrificans]RCX23907.1 hypothetical protein DFQ59_11733 [Thioalbus denitrificans]
MEQQRATTVKLSEHRTALILGGGWLLFALAVVIPYGSWRLAGGLLLFTVFLPVYAVPLQTLRSYARARAGDAPLRRRFVLGLASWLAGMTLLLLPWRGEADGWWLWMVLGVAPVVALAALLFLPAKEVRPRT